MFETTLSTSWEVLVFDAPRYTKTLDRIIGQIIRESARQWLRSMLTSGIPVETGMAKAALVPLGRFLNNVGGLSIAPTRKSYYSKLEGGRQTIGFGEQKQDFKIRDDKSNPLSFLYEFEWSTTIAHFYLEQFYNGTAQSPQVSIIAADNAFERHMFNALEKRLPGLDDFIRWGKK